MSDEQDPEEEAVGHGRPPKKQQFKKGRSGNPQGRPRSERSLTPRQLRRDVLEVAEMPTIIQTARGPRKVTLAQGLLWKLAHRAAHDHGPSMRLFISLYTAALRDHSVAHADHFNFLEYMESKVAIEPEKHRSAADQKLLDDYRKRTRKP